MKFTFALRPQQQKYTFIYYIVSPLTFSLYPFKSNSLTYFFQKIPYWLWVVIAKILGIKLSPDEKPIVSAVLHIATFGSAAGDFYKYFKYKVQSIFFISVLFCTNLAYQVSAVTSNFTKTDLLDGMVSVMVISYFCGLGVYSHRFKSSWS